MDHVLVNAQAALQVVNVPAPAAADGMDIIISRSDDVCSLCACQQVLQALEGSDGVP